MSNIPMRVSPSEKSEMVSQMLFGETFTVAEQHEQWLRVCSEADEYCGWVSANMVDPIEKDAETCKKNPVVSLPFISYPGIGGKTIYVPGGSFLPGFDDEGLSKDIVPLAMRYIGAPYLWGGKTIFGIDCSALIQVVYRMAGYWLPRDAWQQEQCGTNVATEIQSGDLAFFKNEEQKIVHVGILCDSTRIIHASGCVRQDRFDEHGIYNESLGRYTHTLASIKRMNHQS